MCELHTQHRVYRHYYTCTEAKVLACNCYTSLNLLMSGTVALIKIYTPLNSFYKYPHDLTICSLSNYYLCLASLLYAYHIYLVRCYTSNCRCTWGEPAISCKNEGYNLFYTSKGDEVWIVDMEPVTQRANFVNISYLSCSTWLLRLEKGKILHFKAFCKNMKLCTYVVVAINDYNWLAYGLIHCCSSSASYSTL